MFPSNRSGSSGVGWVSSSSSSGSKYISTRPSDYYQQHNSQQQQQLLGPRSSDQSANLPAALPHLQCLLCYVIGCIGQSNCSSTSSVAAEEQQQLWTQSPGLVQ